MAKTLPTLDIIPVAILTASGVASVNRSYYDVSRVAIPASLPRVLVGLFMSLYYCFSDRPARITTEIAVDKLYPRPRGDHDLVALRGTVLSALGLNAA